MKKILFIATLLASWLPFSTAHADNVAKIGTTGYETLQAAFNAADDGAIVLLLGDYDAASEAMAGDPRQFVIKKSITLDGQGHTVTTKGRGFGVGNVIGGVDSNIDVTFKDITIENKASGARCIDTRGKIGSLTLDGVTLKTDGAPSGYTQPLTIGGNQSDIATVNITNSTIQTNEAGTAYYAIITFNPVNMTIKGSTIKGWACIYAKGQDSSAGSAGSTFNIDDCTLVSSNAYSGVSNAFGAFVLEDNDVTINVTNSDITLNNTGDQTQAIVAPQNVTGSVSLGEGNNVTFVEPGQFAFELNSTNSLEVSGGTFNVEVPEEFCADGYIPEDNGNGTYGVKVGTYVAQIGDTKYESLQAAIDAAVAAGNNNIEVDLLADTKLDVTAWSPNNYSIGSATTESITINGNGHTLDFVQHNSDWSNVSLVNDAGGAKLVLNDMNITNSGYNDGPWNRHDINFNCAVELNNVTSDKALAFKNDATLNNVTVNDTGDIYAIWVSPRKEGGQTISINGLNVTCGRGIKIDDQYVSAPVPTTLEIENAKFTTKKKSAILVKSAGGAAITVEGNINITNVAADPSNLVWVDEDRADEYYNVTVTGASLIPEGGEVSYVASLVRGEQTRGYYTTFAAAYNSTDFEDGDTYKLLKTTTEAVEVAKALTIVKNGFTAANLTAAEGFKKTETDEAITFVAFICEIAGVKYETLEAAFAAAEDGQTITLLADCAGNGIKVPQGKFTTGLTVDFAGHTYTVDGETVGSTGTETNGFQLLKDNKLTFKGGTITSTKAKILVQNYSNLTLEGMTLTLNNSGYTSAYTLSNNNGNIVIDGTTINANPAGGFAFDVCRYSSYSSVNVEVKGESVINGDIEISASGSDAKDGFGLTLTSGTLTGEIVIDPTAAAAMKETPEKATVTKANTFAVAAPEGYIWQSNGDGTSKLDMPTVSVGSKGFATLSSTYALDFTNVENIYAYIAVIDEDGEVAYKRIRKVPANTGLLLRNPAGTSDKAKVPVIASTETPESTESTVGNRFVAVPVTIDALATEGNGVTNYILNSIGSKGPGFYQANNKKVAAGKAYLAIPTSTHVKALVFDEDDATGIAEVESFDEGTQATYNLAGQRVPARSAQKGIYIVNGKKIIK